MHGVCPHVMFFGDHDMFVLLVICVGFLLVNLDL